MAQITFSSLAIENFGPFRERQTLVLDVTDQRPVILIKALNGSGKTTLLTALQVGLYGQKAVGGIRRTAYDQLMLGLQRSDALGHAVVEIGLLVEIGVSTRRLLVRREWRRKSDQLLEALQVLEDGAVDAELSQSWDDFIGTILPAELVQLFLFDGEKIEALANPERLPALLKKATEAFLGIGGIEALGNDLKAMERRALLKNKESSSEFETVRAKLQEWQTQAEALDAMLQALTQEQASAMNGAEQAQIALQKYTDEAQRRGLAAYQEAATIRHGVVAGRERVLQARAGLADVMSDPVLPVLWLSKLWPRYRHAWEADQHARHAKLLGQEFKRRDQRVVSSLLPVMPKATVEMLRKAMAEDLQRFSKTRAPIGAVLQDAPPIVVERQLREGQQRLRQEAKQLVEVQTELDRAEQHIGQIPAEEQIGEILHTLQIRSKAASLAEARLLDLRRRVEETQGQLQHVRIRLEAAQQRLGAELRDRSLEAKSLDASGRVRQTLALFKDRLLASKAQWLSEMITVEFCKLLRKRNMIGRVVVDPSSYQVTIEDGKGQELSMERLSAGERQLLAISVLSALIKERKGRFPVVVDTPLARLDQRHRAAMIKQFFATVSHQVVVLSTDQEVDGLAYETLQPYVSAEYVLDYDDACGCTSVARQTVETSA